MCKFSFVLAVVLLCTLSQSDSAAAQGAPLQTGDFSFSISSLDSPVTGPGGCGGTLDHRCAHILNSVTITSTGFVYDQLVVPSSFNVSGFPAGANVQSRIHSVLGTYQLADPTYAADMSSNVFSNADLNQYQQVDSGSQSGVSIYNYGASFPATSDYMFVTTERWGNNSQLIEAFDTLGGSMGTVQVDGNSSDYTDGIVRVTTGSNPQTAFIAVVTLDQFFDASNPTRKIGSFRITYPDNRSDGADHKTFVIGRQTNPSLEIRKSANTLALSDPTVSGETITYVYSVENTGDTALDMGATPISDTMTLGTDGSGASVSLTTGPTLVPASDANSNGLLDIGETFQFNATYILSQAAIDASGVHNTATATANPVSSNGLDIVGVADVSDVSDNDLSGNGTDGGAGSTDDDPTVVAIAPAPNLSISKSADDDTLREVGDVITYTYTVANTGNVTINDVSISDVHNGSGPAPTVTNETLTTDVAPTNDSIDATANDGVWSTLKPDDVVTFTGTYIVTQQDIDTLQ